MATLQVGNRVYYDIDLMNVQEMHRLAEDIKTHLKKFSERVRACEDPDRSAKIQAFKDDFRRQRYIYRLLIATTECRVACAAGLSKDPLYESLMKPVIQSVLADITNHQN
jgi:hypothetical protein